MGKLKWNDVACDKFYTTWKRILLSFGLDVPFWAIANIKTKSFIYIWKCNRNSCCSFLHNFLQWILSRILCIKQHPLLGVDEVRGKWWWLFTTIHDGGDLKWLHISLNKLCIKLQVQVVVGHFCLQDNISRFVVSFNYNLLLHAPYFKAYITICLYVMLMIGAESCKTWTKVFKTLGVIDDHQSGHLVLLVNYR